MSYKVTRHRPALISSKALTSCGWCTATRRVSLASESDLGEYTDSEILRWLVGMLSTGGFQNCVPIDSVLSVTLW